MKVYTSQPLVNDYTKVKRDISRFWDKFSDPVREVLSSHIHVGYYEDNDNLSPIAAQDLLIEKVAAFARIAQNERILDAGCGMGTSSIFLQQRFNARVSGITLSQRQVEIAQENAALAGAKNIDFRVEDAHSLSSFSDNTFDVVWSLESCEQFYDKPLFLRQAYRVLKPGGRLVIVAWCAADEELTGQDARHYIKLCQAFDHVYMPTISFYARAIEKIGFELLKQEDWSRPVEKSWSLWNQLIRQKILTFLWRMGLQAFQTAKAMKLLQQAFEDNKCCYGVLLVQKPSNNY